MWGTPQRSRMTVTGARRPGRRRVPWFGGRAGGRPGRKRGRLRRGRAGSGSPGRSRSRAAYGGAWRPPVRGSLRFGARPGSLSIPGAALFYPTPRPWASNEFDLERPLASGRPAPTEKASFASAEADAGRAALGEADFNRRRALSRWSACIDEGHQCRLISNTGALKRAYNRARET